MVEFIDTAMRPVDRWLHNYALDHQNAVNQRIHTVCVPLIFASVAWLLWCIPVPGTWFRPGTWAALSLFAVWMYYYRLSRPLGLAALAFFALIMYSAALAYPHIGIRGLLFSAISAFVIGWIGQFIGHRIEGRKPSFFTDLTYLLIGPLWVIAKLFRAVGLRY